MTKLKLTDYSRIIAQKLLAIGAVSLRPQEPFVWTSGLKSPIYCDNRLTMSFPEVRDLIADGFAEIIREKLPHAEILAGTATAGIPHAAWAAQKLNAPMIYIRDKAKGHGKQNQIEGKLEAGSKVVVIEDLISTGGSSLKAAQAVREAGAEVLAVVAIFSYQFEATTQQFAKANVPLFTLSNYTSLLEEALQQGIIKSDELQSLQSWRENPAAFM